MIIGRKKVKASFILKVLSDSRKGIKNNTQVGRTRIMVAAARPDMNEKNSRFFRVKQNKKTKAKKGMVIYICPASTCTIQACMKRNKALPVATAHCWDIFFVNVKAISTMEINMMYSNASQIREIFLWGKSAIGYRRW